MMAQQIDSTANIVSTIWLLLGFFIFIANTVTTVFLWRTKNAREKLFCGVYQHSMWNLLGVHASFAGVGLTLTISSVTRLSIDGELTKDACHVFGFLLTFFFYFAAMGILIGLINKLYCLLKPFAYHSYVRTRSKSPMVAFFSCVLYGFINALFPLVNLGEYSQKTLYTTCLMNWDDQVSTQFIGILNLTLAITGFGFLSGNFWLQQRLVKNRRQMQVSLTRPKETIVFVLSVSGLFLICWTPYMVAMLVIIHSEHTQIGDKEKAILFGITLIPLFFNPFLTYRLHGFFREECKNTWDSFKKIFPAKKIRICKNRGEKPTNSFVIRTIQEYENPVANTCS